MAIRKSRKSNRVTSAMRKSIAALRKMSPKRRRSPTRRSPPIRRSPTKRRRSSSSRRSPTNPWMKFQKQNYKKVAAKYPGATFGQIISILSKLYKK